MTSGTATLPSPVIEGNNPNTSTSCPEELAGISFPERSSSASRLANKRSRSVDSNLHKKQYERGRRSTPFHQVVETSTIYAKHDRPSTLLSSLGEPEEAQGQVNQYHILRPIGSGAFGRVVLCRNEQDRRYYACKIVSKSRLRKKFRWANASFPRAGSPCGPPSRPGSAESASNSRDYLCAIKREVAILKKLSKHPNINALVEVLDDGKEDNLYMIFELCEYGPIMHISPTETVAPIPEARARKYFRDVVLGLEYLHYKKIIHRDLKPENLLLKKPPDGSDCKVVQIADFGISTMFEEDEDCVLSDKNASPMFSPPEACESHTKDLKGKAVDIWALGVTLYCLVHGRCPYSSPNIIELCRQIVHDDANISAKLSFELQNLLYRMLQKDPDDRITLPEIKVHPWVTHYGTDPMMSTECNCVFEDVTEEEVENAFKPAMMFVSKIRNILKGKNSKRGTNPPVPALPHRGLSNDSPASPRAVGVHAVNGVLQSRMVQQLAHSSMRVSASADGLNRLNVGPSLKAAEKYTRRSRSFDQNMNPEAGLSPPPTNGPASAPPMVTVTPSHDNAGEDPAGVRLSWSPLIGVSPPSPPGSPSGNAAPSSPFKRRGSSMKIIDELPEGC
ncbi:hypothetical protein HK104_010586 [Borealophlyctis nickersoniae]|nr:hypothetical protein HK104_010586 [Borealophlyctis nickersoniae]